MNEFPTEKKESIDAIRFFLRYWKAILISVLSSIVLAVIITFFVPKEYYAYGTVFPTASNSLDVTLENPIFGYDIEADRLIQILQSKEMESRVVKKFDLVNYYELDSADVDWIDELRKEYHDDIYYTRNISMSVVISARMKDAQLAADIVNYIIDNVNELRSKVIKQNFETAYKTYEKQYSEKCNYVDSLLVQISLLRDEFQDPKMMILSNQQYNLNLINSNKKYQNSTRLEKAINEYMYQQTSLNELHGKYEKARLAWEKPVSSIYILDRASVSWKKVYPSFSMNIIIAGLGALFLSWFVLFLKDRITRIKKDLYK